METRIRNKRLWVRRIVLCPFSNSSADPWLHTQVSFPHERRVYMERSNTSESANRISLESDLRNWFRGQGVSEEAAARAVSLLDARTLLSQPRPGRWNRRGTFGVQERCRYLWYRHSARILGWCERRRFPDLVTSILRGHVFPAEGGGNEATREDGSGRVTAAAHAGSIAIDPDRHYAGKSSIICGLHRFSISCCGGVTSVRVRCL